MRSTSHDDTLFYGDNLHILRAYIEDESVDLVYLDPPFNSNASYNVLFRAPTGESSTAQIEAFEDTWHWNEKAERAFDEVILSGNSEAAEMLRAMRSFLKENDMMAYLAMMAVRLIELHRVLKRTGSLYLHCDPTASHYLKILLDSLFGASKFRSEIVWKRSGAHSDAKQGRRLHGHIHDNILRKGLTGYGIIFSRRTRTLILAATTDSWMKLVDGATEGVILPRQGRAAIRSTTGG